MPLNLLISQTEIAAIVAQLAQHIDRDYQGRSPIVIVILKGAMIFAGDLTRAMETPIKQIELMRLASYGSGTKSSGEVVLQGNLSEDLLREQDLLVVEDIVDTGQSWATLKTQLLASNPRSLKICTLLDKPSRRQVAVTLDYVGRQVEDHFIVGYGLDLAEKYRQLPAIYRWQA